MSECHELSSCGFERGIAAVRVLDDEGDEREGFREAEGEEGSPWFVGGETGEGRWSGLAIRKPPRV